MKIADLFIDLTMKGSEKTIGALKSVKDFLTDTQSSALATKAAILGAVYALERLTETAGQHGAGLKNFQALTGEVDTKWIQQFGELVRRGTRTSFKEGLSDAEGTYKSVSSNIFNMRAHGQVPEGFAEMMRVVGAKQSDLQDPKKMIENTFEFLRKTQNDPKNRIVANQFAKNLGFSEADIATAYRRKERIDQVFGGGLISEKTTKRLDEVAGHWSNFWTRLEVFNEKMTSGFGLPVVAFLDAVLAKVEAIANKLEPTIKLLLKASTLFVSGKEVFGPPESLREPDSNPESHQERIKKSLESNKFDFWKWLNKDFHNEDSDHYKKNYNRKDLPSGEDIYNRFKIIAPEPKVRLQPSAYHSKVENNNVFNIHGDNAADIGQEVNRHLGRQVNTAYRQNPAVYQST